MNPYKLAFVDGVFSSVNRDLRGFWEGSRGRGGGLFSLCLCCNCVFVFGILCLFGLVMLCARLCGCLYFFCGTVVCLFVCFYLACVWFVFGRRLICRKTFIYDLFA